jgi:hypothetical protein
VNKTVLIVTVAPTEQVGVAVTLYTYIHEVPSSDLDVDTGYPD